MKNHQIMEKSFAYVKNKVKVFVIYIGIGAAQKKQGTLIFD
jgi:hypothetical protein